MPNKTYHDHAVKATPVNADEIPIWSVAESAARRVTRANLLGGTLTGAGTIATGGYTLTVPATGTAMLREDLGAVLASYYGFATGASAAENTTAINAAMTAATALGVPAIVMLPPGWFDVNPFTVSANLYLRGAKMPVLNRGAGTLSTGTVLRGTGVIAGNTLVTLSSRSGLMDLGVDVSAYATAKNAIAGDTASDDCMLLNVAALGTGTMHGAVFTNSVRTLIDNYSAAAFDHGLVFKNSHNKANNLSFWNCGISAVTLTSDGGNPVVGNLITHLHSDGTAIGDGGGLRLYTGGASVTHVIGNVIDTFYIHNAGHAIYCASNVATGRLLQRNRFANGYIEACTSNGVWLDGVVSAAGDGPDYNDFANITATSAPAYGFNNQYGGTHNSLHNCRTVACGTPTFGTWQKVDVGFGGMSSLILHLTKSASQTLTTGVQTDITWDGGLDNNVMHTTGAVIGDPPMSGALCRIRASIAFGANATGMRRVSLLRSLSGGAYTQVGPEALVSPGNGTCECQVNLEYITPFNGGYEFKAAAQHTAGANLDVLSTSHLTVEMLV